MERSDGFTPDGYYNALEETMPFIRWKGRSRSQNESVVLHLQDI